nr:MAG TPA: hypothetical protein [Caudoviricetes sp.]
MNEILDEKKSWLFYKTWNNMFLKLPKAEAGELLQAMCALEEGVEFTIENPILEAVFSTIKEQMLANTERFYKEKERRQNASKKGVEARAEKKKQSDNESLMNNQPIVNQSFIKRLPNVTYKDKDEDEDKVEDEDKDEVEEEEKDKKTKTVSHSSLRSECSVPETGFGDSENGQPDKKIPVEREQTDYKAVVDSYNSLCKSFPKVTKLSERRRKAIRARLKEYSFAELEKAFALAEESEFLKGANNRNWMASFDWIISDSNLPKVLEGKYANRASPNGNSGKSQSMWGDDDFVAKVIRGETSLAEEGWFNGMGKVVDERGNPA